MYMNVDYSNMHWEKVWGNPNRSSSNQLKPSKQNKSPFRLKQIGEVQLLPSLYNVAKQGLSSCMVPTLGLIY